MIILQQKSDCCGCSACVQVCPVHCILMHRDEEGFEYPVTDTSICINCHLCEKVCPVLNEIIDDHVSPSVYAAVAKSASILKQSSSGGVFSLLAENTIRSGGVVYGAAYECGFTRVSHRRIAHEEDLHLLMGSKYMQSGMGEIFTNVRDDLRRGTLVLFSGTPCQVKGLRLFLRRKYDNLITVDVACHSVPSPKVWTAFLEDLCQRRHVRDIGKLDMSLSSYSDHLGQLTKTLVISNRSGKVIYMDSMYATSYGRCFLDSLLSRPSCFYCPAKDLRSGSDITLGDYWGVSEILPELSVQKGVSVVIIKTEQGRDAASSIIDRLSVWERGSYESALKNNGGLHSDELIKSKERRRDLFYQRITRTTSSREIAHILEEMAPPRQGKWKIEVRKFLKYLGLLKAIRILRNFLHKSL